jgi:hypothetical protein
MFKANLQADAKDVEEISKKHRPEGLPIESPKRQRTAP